MKNESKIFFDLFATGITLMKNSNQTDALNTIYDKLDSNEYTLVRAVPTNVAKLVYTFLEPLFAYEEAYELLYTYNLGEVSIIVYADEDMPKAVFNELHDIEGHTIKQLLRDGTELKSKFHKYK